ncbi:hypothetical protein [Variovorax sp. JS1663]|uniref:hypothetical protein n=1 Tax=Variovorax sp. JS1663 TaxID=1851577 RepID=UPI0011807919|nr:hypothetical protein [Variovorax sp. JS1663]
MDERTGRIVDAEIANLIGETARLNAQAAKLHKVPFWPPVWIAAGLMAAGAAFFVALTKLLGPLV